MVGVGVHFNPFVPHSPLNQVKYGVIATRALQTDLTSWQHLYISGRLHKPVEILIPHDTILSLQSHNLRAAAAAALLLLPHTFTEHELYEAICRISYSGDVRMALAEDPNKISRIVSGGFHHFRALYRSSLQHFLDSGCLCSAPAELSAAGTQSDTLMEQESSTSSRRFLLQHLPMSVLASLSRHLLPTPPYLPRSPLASHFREGSTSHSSKMCENPSSPTLKQPSVATSAAALSRPLALSTSRKMLCAELAAQLARRVRLASARQAIAGVLAAGPAHAMRYLSKKLAKAWMKT
ncbi:hypothetical protein CLOM_g20891 [Closterium sp. NIES-68]|nr:hypothetical protein CLOM_g20891 [Closterium sp. NIES-68]